MGPGIASAAADPFVFPTVTPDPNPIIVHGRAVNCSRF
jgi:hypothetical protein